MMRWSFFAFSFAMAAGWVHAAPGGESATDTHKVKHGESLWSISRLHGVSVGELMDLNHLNDSVVRDGQVLKIPRAPSDPALAPAKATTHVIAKGETFRSIARKFGLTQDDLEHANPRIDPTAPKVGAKLVIPATVAASDKGKPEPGRSKSPAEDPKPKTRPYIVSVDETPLSISEAFNISVRELYELNGLQPGSPLEPGSEILVPVLPK